MKVTVISNRITPRGALSLVAERPIAAGEIVVDCNNAVLTPTRTRRTVQLDYNRHLQDPQIDFIDHSCEPNAVLDVDAPSIVALRAVKLGESITIYYPGSEVELAQAFDCRCGAPTCQGRIKGAFYLSAGAMRWALERRYCTRFIRAELGRLLKQG